MASYAGVEEEENDIDKENKWEEILRALFFLKTKKARSYPEDYLS